MIGQYGDEESCGKRRCEGHFVPRNPKITSLRLYVNITQAIIHTSRSTPSATQEHLNCREKQLFSFFNFSHPQHPSPPALTR